MTDRRYEILSLLSQMVIVPVLITFGGFSLLPVSAEAMSGYGYHAERLVYLIAALTGPFIIGAVIGFIFAKITGKKDVSPRVKHWVPIWPVLYGLFFAILVLLLSGGNVNSNWWALHALKNPAFFIFGVALMFSGLHMIVPVAEISGYGGYLAGFLLHERLSRAAGTFKAPRMIAGFWLLMAAILAYTGIAGAGVIKEGITEFRYGRSVMPGETTEYDLIASAPFREDNGLAQLGYTASLQFEDLGTMPRLDGATAFYPVYAAFTEAVYKGLGDYYRENSDRADWNYYAAFVDSDMYPLDIIKCTKTSKAYERLITGEADMIFVLEPSLAHFNMVKARGDEFVLTQIASEAFVFFANVQNPVKSLTVEEIQKIYAGEITNWREVGGENRNILPYQRPENSGSQTIMLSQVMQGVPMIAPTTETFAEGMGMIIEQVAGYKNAKNAIGYSFMYYSSQMVTSNEVRYLAVDGVEPAADTIRNGSYPLTVPIYAVTLASNTDKNVRKLLEWVVSKEGQTLIQRTGYVSLSDS
jgi:phosphate transport system substrate-binding protein